MNNIKETINELLENRSKESIEELIKINRGLMYKVLNSYSRGSDEDAYNCAMIGLWQAIIKFDKSKGYEFSTFASICITNALNIYLRDYRKHRYVCSYDEFINGTDGESILSKLYGDNTVDNEFIPRENLRIIYRMIKDTNVGIKRNILKMWYNNNFDILNATLAEKNCCSETYASKVIRDFRKKIKLHIKGEEACKK